VHNADTQVTGGTTTRFANTKSKTQLMQTTRKFSQLLIKNNLSSITNARHKVIPFFDFQKTNTVQAEHFDGKQKQRRLEAQPLL
jgi:hypothetical protein